MDRVFGLFSAQTEYIPYDEENDGNDGARSLGAQGPADGLPAEGQVVNFDLFEGKRRPAQVDVQDSWGDPLGQIRQVSTHPPCHEFDSKRLFCECGPWLACPHSLHSAGGAELAVGFPRFQQWAFATGIFPFK